METQVRGPVRHGEWRGRRCCPAYFFGPCLEDFSQILTINGRTVGDHSCKIL